MNDLARLDARSFHFRLGDLLRTELVALGAFLVAPAEFDRRRLFRDLGYASFFEYLHRGLKLSRGAAHHRRAGASLVRRFPEVLAPIEDGRLCFSTVAVVASVLTEENRAEVLPRFFGLSKQEALELAAELRPRAVVPARTVVTRVEAVGAAGTASAEAVPETLRGITEEFGRIVHPGELGTVHATEPVGAGSAGPIRPMTTVEPMTAMTTVVPMTATASRLHITVSREFLALLRKARAGESHRSPGATDEQILKLALEALVEKQGKRKASVPAKVKREVVKRDKGKCQWELPDGSICGATARLEIDHVIPRGKGGADTVENCRVLCKGHNLEAARQAYGDEVMDLFTQGGERGPVAGEELAAYVAPGGLGRSGRRSRAGPPLRLEHRPRPDRRRGPAEPEPAGREGHLARRHRGAAPAPRRVRAGAGAGRLNPVRPVA